MRQAPETASLQQLLNHIARAREPTSVSTKDVHHVPNQHCRVRPARGRGLSGDVVAALGCLLAWAGAVRERGLRNRGRGRVSIRIGRRRQVGVAVTGGSSICRRLRFLLLRLLRRRQRAANVSDVKVLRPHAGRDVEQPRVTASLRGAVKPPEQQQLRWGDRRERMAPPGGRHRGALRRLHLAPRHVCARVPYPQLIVRPWRIPCINPCIASSRKCGSAVVSPIA